MIGGIIEFVTVAVVVALLLVGVSIRESAVPSDIHTESSPPSGHVIHGGRTLVELDGDATRRQIEVGLRPDVQGDLAP